MLRPEIEIHFHHAESLGSREGPEGAGDVASAAALEAERDERWCLAHLPLILSEPKPVEQAAHILGRPSYLS